MDGGDENRGKMPLVILAGPTAAGKTEVSLAVAEALNAEIISCDSAQVFRGVNIGTAKIPWEQRRHIPHYGIDLVGPDQPFSVAEYQEYAAAKIRDVLSRGKLPLLVGGTGLWIRAVIRNYSFPPQDAALSTAVRRHIRQLGEEVGWDKLHALLLALDPASYAAIAVQDKNRMARALEVFWMTGQPMQRSPQISPYDFDYWVLTRPVSDLHRRIGERVGEMVAQGLPSEVLNLLANGVPPNAQSLSAIGYREMVHWAFGRSTSGERDAAVILHTRQFAKRQLTWFRSEKDARWLDLSSYGLSRVTNQVIQSSRRFIDKISDCQSSQ